MQSAGIIIELCEAIGRHRALTDRETDILVRAIQCHKYKPERTKSVHWTSDEDATLRKMLKRNMSAAEIADKLGRTRFAIHSRVKRMRAKNSPNMRNAQKRVNARHA